MIYQGKHPFIFFGKYLDKLYEYEHKVLFPVKDSDSRFKDELEEYSNIFANSLDDFLFKLQQENMFLLLGKKGKARLEIENINSRSCYNIITDKGITNKIYKKSHFQKKYPYKEERKKIEKYIQKSTEDKS